MPKPTRRSQGAAANRAALTTSTVPTNPEPTHRQNSTGYNLDWHTGYFARIRGLSRGASLPEIDGDNIADENEQKRVFYSRLNRILADCPPAGMYLALTATKHVPADALNRVRRELKRREHEDAEIDVIVDGLLQDLNEARRQTAADFPDSRPLDGFALVFRTAYMEYQRLLQRANVPEPEREKRVRLMLEAYDAKKAAAQ
jgi:hypothetical protein